MKKSALPLKLLWGVCAILAVCSLIFSSCEKEVDIDLASESPRLVVEGSIETGLPPYVILTNTIGFFGEINVGTLASSFVHDANITVSDGLRTVTLKEYTFDTGGANLFYYYTVDSTTFLTNPFLGQEEKFYTLRIEKDGQVYTATTKIPTPTPLDSVLSVYPEAPFDKDKYPRARQVRISFRDPDTSGNYIQYYTRRNDEPFYMGLNSVYSDELINGSKFSTTMWLGEPRSGTRSDTTGTASVGDEVIFKWCAIDKQTYDFWNTYEFSLGNVGNPFATPTNLKSNISNNAIGIWAGYGSKYYNITME